MSVALKAVAWARRFSQTVKRLTGFQSTGESWLASFQSTGESQLACFQSTGEFLNFYKCATRRYLGVATFYSIICIQFMCEVEQ